MLPEFSSQPAFWQKQGMTIANYYVLIIYSTGNNDTQ